MQEQFLAPFGFFQFQPMETPFFYTIVFDGRPIGHLALRFGNLETLKQKEKGGRDDSYIVSEGHWMPVETVTDGLKYLIDGAEDRFYDLNINEAYRTAQRLQAYNRTAHFRKG